MNLDKIKKYIGIAQAVAALSKDQSTKVGAVILGPSQEVLSVGYNGAPRGCLADEDHRGTQRPEKYFWFSHGELNAITNAARVGIPLEGGTLIVTAPPCMDCARAIVQAGIKAVIAIAPDAEFLERWGEHVQRSNTLFHETGVDYMWINGDTWLPSVQP